MSFSQHSSKLNAVAFLLMALLLLAATCLLWPLPFVSSAPSAVVSNNVASSCVVPASPFFDYKACPLEEEVAKMIEYHYVVVALETTMPLPLSWLSKISSFLLHHYRTATSAAWLLDMQMMLSRFSLSTAIDLIENVGRSGWCWFHSLKVKFAEYAEYVSAKMMASIVHAPGVLLKAPDKLYSTLTSNYDLPAWTLHLPTVILRDIPTALYGKSSALLRSFQSSDAVVSTYPDSHPTLLSIQPCEFDLLIDSPPAPFTTAAAPINVTPTSGDWRETLRVASGLVGVDKSVLVSSPRVLHPPMFTIFITLDPAMAWGERNYTLLVNIDLVVLVIALLSMMAVRVVFNRVVEGFKSKFLHLTNWNDEIFFDCLPLELFDSPASACYESCESSLSLGSASGEAVSTQAAPHDPITSSSSSQPVTNLPVSSSDVTAAPSNQSPSKNTTTIDPLYKVIRKLRWHRRLDEIRMEHMLASVGEVPTTDLVHSSSYVVIVLTGFLRLVCRFTGLFVRRHGRSTKQEDCKKNHARLMWELLQHHKIVKKTKKNHARLMRELLQRHKIGRIRKIHWLLSLGEEVPRSPKDDPMKFLHPDPLYWIFCSRPDTASGWMVL